MSRLPPELLSHVVDCLIPANPPVAFPASHVVTRTLLSLCLVSRTVHYAAIRRLFAHCMYIDGPGKLEMVLRTLRDYRLGQAFGSTIGPPESSFDKDHPNTHRGNTPTSCIHSLFLAPYPDSDIESPIIASSISSLCEILAPNLIRLVIDMYLRCLRPDEDRFGVRIFLHNAFRRLTALEEFVSTRDELYLDLVERSWDHPELAVWSTWPNLRRLALYNVDASAVGFLRDIQQCKALTHLVLTRSDGITVDLGLASQPGLPQLRGVSTHLRRVFVVNTAGWFRYRPAFSRRRWKDCFLGKVWNLQSSAPLPLSSSQSSHGHRLGLEVVRIDVPIPAGEDEDGDCIEICQEWVREAAIEGTLWDAQGTYVLSVKAASPLGPPGLANVGWRRPSDESGKLEVADWESDSE